MALYKSRAFDLISHDTCAIQQQSDSDFERELIEAHIAARKKREASIEAFMKKLEDEGTFDLTQSEPEPLEVRRQYPKYQIQFCPTMSFDQSLKTRSRLPATTKATTVMKRTGTTLSLSLRDLPHI